MRRILIIIACFGVPLFSFAGIIPLYAGQSYVFSFSASDFVYQSNVIGDEWGVELERNGRSYTSASINIYSNSLSETPHYSIDAIWDRTFDRGPRLYSQPFTFNDIESSYS